ELRAGHRSAYGDERLFAVAWHVEEHASRDQAFAECGDVREARSTRVDLLRGIAAIPHAVAIPDVAERVHVRGRNAVVLKPVIVADGAAGTALVDLDELLLGAEWAAERY